ncbi:winged helix-turn-helix domain-containing protein [Blautia glucerasea]|uniref:winged helix-turn-helix domain-containing protein n=1 Tax=Blautia glucerasea TaxID=536633 RepID=UPI001D0225B0|nr:winged helix-turn-helix domain-containing protein [Blautia glucerasea]MCB5388330.1 winged helix-turn-helix domain-containing protein [Blautia glucerasea]MCB5423362.1 winged helix-turn-helix domain-containing protein [Blautia luti]
MFYDDLNTEEQVSYLIKPILQVLQEAGGQLERSEIRDRISELDEHIAEFEQKLYTSNKTGNQYKKFDFKFNFAIKELSYVGLISYVKFNPKIIYGILSIVLIVGMFFTGCASKNNASQLNTNVSNLPIHQMHASFVYDTDNIREAVGICDYVFVAKVVSCDGTEYRNVITTEDEKGNPKEVGSPYTNYTIQVLENIKGELITDKPIPIVKQGGISEKQDAIYLFENDSLPSENSIYIFLAYAQEDGSLLISGPNSNVMCNDSNMYSINSVSEEKSVTEYDEFITYKDANDNEIIPVDRERYKSIYETDNN